MATQTSLLLASYEEVLQALENGFVFPAMAIPFGADESTPCRFFVSGDEIAIEHVA